MPETHPRKTTRVHLCAAALLAPALILAGCAGGGSTLPEKPGIYAKRTTDEGEQLIRLGQQGGQGWARASNLSPDVELLIASAGMGTDPSLFDDYVTLTRAGWVRSEIGEDGTVRPTAGREYAAPDLPDYRLGMSYSYVGARNGLHVVRATPDGRLQPGFYAVEAAPAASRDVRGHFGVQADQLDRDRYAQNNCLDRLIGEAGPSYRPCAADAGRGQAGTQAAEGDSRAADGESGSAAVGAVEQRRLQAPEITRERTGEPGSAADPARRAQDGRSARDAGAGAAADPAQPAAGERSIDSLTPGLHIRDLSVDRARRPEGDVLLIRGEVVNADTEAHDLPGLRGSIVHPNGEVLQRWTFQPNARRLGPGESTRFTTVRDATEEGGKRVEIRFNL
jgi:hypothetical protein